MTEKRNESRLHLCWLVFLGIILIRGFAGGGINMTSGLFLAPVAEEIGVGIGSLSIYFSIISVVMVLWLPMAGRLINRYDIRVMAIAGAVLQAVPFALLGLLNQVYGWYIMAVPMAMGATILVSLLGPILINRWFARHAGLMMGLQMAFVGIFGAILQPYASNLIVSDGWRRTYMIIGGLTFIAVVVSALILLRNRPEDRGLKPYGAGMMQQEKQENNAVSSGGQIEIAEAEAVRSASFYLLLFFMIAITGVGVFTQHIPTFSGMRGFTMEQTGNALAFTSLGNAVGSVVIGFVCDKIGSLKTCYGIIGLGSVTVIGFMVRAVSFPVFGLLTFLHGLATSGIMVLAPILTLTFYGKKDYEKIYAKVSMGAPLASILLIPAYGFVYDLTDSYTLVLVGMLGLLLLAAFCIGLGWKKRCTAAGCPAWKKS